MSLKNVPMARFDWERVIARAELPTITKSVAMFIAMRANQDGSSAHPGERWLADVLDVTERYINTQIALLRALGLIERTAHGRVDEAFDTYQLTVPAADDIPLRMRLNPNGHRYIPRPEPKKRLRKPKDGPAATGTPFPEAPDDTDTATGTPLPVAGPAAADATGTPLPEGSVPTGTGVPVDNHDYQNQGSGSDPVENPGGSRATGTLVPSYRNSGADLPEPQFLQGDPYQPSTNTGSPEATDSPGESIKPVDSRERDWNGLPTPSLLAAAALDGDGTVATNVDARTEIEAARTALAASGDAARWRAAARKALAARDRHHPADHLVTVVAAELYRRSLTTAAHHPDTVIMNGAS